MIFVNFKDYSIVTLGKATMLHIMLQAFGLSLAYGVKQNIRFAAACIPSKKPNYFVQIYFMKLYKINKNEKSRHILIKNDV